MSDERSEGTGLLIAMYRSKNLLFFRVALPDGRIQIVTYHADPVAGFVADVKYEGVAAYPQHHPAPYKAAAPVHHRPAPLHHAPPVHHAPRPIHHGFAG